MSPPPPPPTHTHILESGGNGAQFPSTEPPYLRKIIRNYISPILQGP